MTSHGKKSFTARRLRKIARHLATISGFCIGIGLGSTPFWIPLIDVQTAVAIAPLIAAPIFAYWYFLIAGQLAADRELRELIAGADINVADCSIILFLRSFKTARSSFVDRILQWGITVRATLKLYLVGSAKNMDSYFDFDAEEELDDAIGNGAVFLAIGNKEASFGAGKLIVPDDRWEAVFANCAIASRIIFLMPGPSEAVMWEAKELLNSPSLTSKLVFIMPRELSESTRQRVTWKRTREMASANLGIDLPEYDPTGCFFRLQVGQGMVDRVALEMLTRRLSAARRARQEFDLEEIWPRADTSSSHPPALT